MTCAQKKHVKALCILKKRTVFSFTIVPAHHVIQRKKAYCKDDQPKYYT